MKLACQVWALSHGVAMLAMRDQLQKGFGVDPQEILLEGVERLVAGAMARAGRPASAPSPHRRMILTNRKYCRATLLQARGHYHM